VAIVAMSPPGARWPDSWAPKAPRRRWRASPTAAGRSRG